MANPNQKQFEYVNILGVRVDQVSLDALIKFMIETSLQGRKAVVANVNVHAMNLAYEQTWFRHFLNDSEMVFCDGFGVKWAAKLFYGFLLYRLTFLDWFYLFADRCAESGVTIYLLGGKPGVAESAASVLTSKRPSLKIVGTHHGYFDKSRDSSEQHTIIDEINQLQPNILAIGLGMPFQEKWIQENFGNLNVNIVLPGGAFLDFISGTLQRSPNWMTDHGFEWLGRLIIEPRRLWKRYLLGNPLFIFRVLLNRFGLIRINS
jgi:N-acetylglucosaminyldiphosphoundecaprenol N-acetyl-beta-D-mannosaminyltransferase